MKSGKKFSDLFYNVVTYAGVMVSLLVLTVEAFLFVLDFFDKGRNLYLGLITYLILPGLLIFGLLLIPAGVLWKQSRLRRGLPAFELRRFRIDLSLPHHRNALLVFIVGTALLILMSLVGAYKAFHYTESTKFCGVLCHEVMDPEYTAYTNSPHGRVKCVECHIGAGADWYVRSKLSGSRQVLKAATRTFERPIRTPVHDLRPAEETCEQCHWPGKFYGTRDFNRDYFLTEGEDPRWHVRMLLNIGGGTGQNYGVHAHMNVERDVYYAADETRQNISWVKSVGKDGKETIYVSPDSKYKAGLPPPENIRHMDCIDCHNRPTHQFAAPYRLVNEAMQDGRIDPSLPSIKEKALGLLSKKYASKDEGLRVIKNSLHEYYKKKDPAFYDSNREKIERASAYLAEAYARNMFPEMKVRWDTHPDNVGHLVSAGCFRCHDGEHRSPEGKVITHECNACHTIIEQGPSGAVEKNMQGIPFQHPVDVGDDWKTARCDDCHSGA